MNKELLFEAIGFIDENHLADREKNNTRRNNLKRELLIKSAALAACICFIFLAGYVLSNIGGSAGTPGGTTQGTNHNSATDGHSEDGSYTFMSYAGPVFPLTLRLEEHDLLAERNLTLDFQPWVSSDTDDILVRDEYLLSNPSSEDKTVTVLYPFAGSLWDLEKQLPTLSSGGTSLPASLLCGGYSGHYTDTDKAPLFPDQLKSWEKYKQLLSGTDYLDRAIRFEADFTTIPVIVYKFTDAYCTADKKRPNPSVRIEFSIDYEKTTLLTWYFNGSRQEPNAGARVFSIGAEAEPSYRQPKYLIVLGEDISNVDAACYVTGGPDTKEKITDGSAGFTLTRYETTLDAVLREILPSVIHTFYTRNNLQLPIPAEDYYTLLCEYLEGSGLLVPMPHAESDYLDDICSRINTNKRVMYLSSELTIPAGETVPLTAAMQKDGSYDFYTTGTKNAGVYGYDTVTKLGTNLNFNRFSASIEDYGTVEIVGQNFGFDLEHDKRTVDLSLEKEHYYLEAKRKQEWK